MAIETSVEAGNLVEFSVTGEVGKGDIEQAAETLKQALDTHNQVSLLMEINVEGMSFEAILADISLGLRHLGDYYRFDKIAVVTDQGWIRTLVKWEAMMLRNFDLRVFEGEQRAAAREWVSGPPADKQEVPGIIYQETSHPNLLVFTVGEKITGADLRDLAKRIEAICAEHGQVDLLAREVRIPKLGRGALIEDLKMFDLLKKIRRYAVVSDMTWLKTYTSFVNSVFSMEIQQFSNESEAMEWVTQS